MNDTTPQKTEPAKQPSDLKLIRACVPPSTLVCLLIGFRRGLRDVFKNNADPDATKPNLKLNYREMAMAATAASFAAIELSPAIQDWVLREKIWQFKVENAGEKAGNKVGEFLKKLVP